MASHQQYHDLLEQQKAMMSAIKSMQEQLNSSNSVIKSMEEQLNAAFKSLREEVQEKNVQSEKLKCSFINRVQQVFEDYMNQLLQLQTSALPSNISSLPHQPESSASENFLLCFRYEGIFPNFLTKINVEDVISSLTVDLCDHTEKRVEIGPKFCSKDLKVKFLVLDGDLKDNYTEKDFENHVVIPREYKGPLLKGDSEVSLSNGSARVCGFSFTDNSSKTAKNGKFRLGAKLINGDHFGWIVRPAVSPPFQVKENRLKSSLKHTTPKPEDKLYHLKNISKNGEIYRRAKERVDTVMDFLQLYHTDENELLSTPGSNGMKWKETVDNAKECNLSKERYKYEYRDDESGDVILLKCDFQIESVTFKGQPSQPYESLVDFQMEKVNKLRKAAYKKRRELKKVYDSTNQTPQVQAGSGCPSEVQRKEQQPLAPPSNMDPNAGGPVEHIYSDPAENHDNGQQDMNASASITTDASTVQYTALEVETNSSGACGCLTEQVADEHDSYNLDMSEAFQGIEVSGGWIADGLDLYDYDTTEAYQGEINRQGMFYDNIENRVPSPLYFTGIDVAQFNQFPDEALNQPSANMLPKSAWRKLAAILRWFKVKYIVMHRRPQKKQKIK